jgi:MFS family permease
MADPADGRRDQTRRDGSGLSGEILVLGAVVVLGAIMTVLDLTIANVAIPTLGRDFGASISTIQRVMTGYLLAFASVIRSPAGDRALRSQASLDLLPALVPARLGAGVGGGKTPALRVSFERELTSTAVPPGMSVAQLATPQRQDGRQRGPTQAVGTALDLPG